MNTTTTELPRPRYIRVRGLEYWAEKLNGKEACVLLAAIAEYQVPLGRGPYLHELPATMQGWTEAMKTLRQRSMIAGNGETEPFRVLPNGLNILEGVAA
jgi:hypothetical protein